MAHLLTDPRRFHAPTAVLERVHQLFKGPPLLDPAAFEESTLNAPISIPFPDIMDSDGWRVPVVVANPGGNAAAAPTLGPIESCFMHVPVLPSKRRYETDTEVILLDDCRLAGQLNAKLWEEFSNGNWMLDVAARTVISSGVAKHDVHLFPTLCFSFSSPREYSGSNNIGSHFGDMVWKDRVGGLAMRRDVRVEVRAG